MDKCYLDLALKQVDNKWIATGSIKGDFAFNGEGSTQAEAIGDFMIHNREQLKFQFGFVADDGSIQLSTKFGKGRSEMGPNERKYLKK